MPVDVEEKYAWLKAALERGLEVRTVYRDRQVVEIGRPSPRYVALKYADGGSDKFHISDLARRKFLIKI